MNNKNMNYLVQASSLPTTNWLKNNVVLYEVLRI